jgi:hypothetical protein
MALPLSFVRDVVMNYTVHKLAVRTPHVQSISLKTKSENSVDHTDRITTFCIHGFLTVSILLLTFPSCSQIIFATGL